jgi:zinc protease
MKFSALFLVAASIASAGTASADDFRATAPATGPRRLSTPPAIREATLPNGVRVLVIERHRFPIVSLRLLSDVGVLRAEPGLPQLATASLRVLSSNDKETYRAVNEFGAEVSADADWDGMHLDVNCLAPAMGRAVKLLSTMASDPPFSKSAVGSARSLSIQGKDDVRGEADVALHKRLYPADNAMHDGLRGPRAAMETVTAEQLRGYFARAFAPSRTTLIVVGDTTLEAVTPAAAKWLGAASAPAVPVADPASSSVAPKRGLTIVDRRGATQAEIALGAIGVSRTSPDFAAVNVLVRALSQRLDAVLRQQHGYTYDFRASVNGRRSSGEIVIEGKVELARAGESVREILAAIDRIRSAPLADDEFALARRSRSSDPRSTETNASAAELTGDMVELGLPLDTWSREAAAFSAVTKDDVLRVARQYLDPAHMPMVVVGDAKTLVPMLPEIGDPPKTP